MPVGVDHPLDGVNEDGFWNGRHAKPAGTGLHAACVFFGAEEDDAVRFGAVGLHALKQPLSKLSTPAAGE